MSAALVRKSLSLVDCDINEERQVCRKKSKSCQNIPERHKLVEKIRVEGKKAKKVNLLTSTKKISIIDVRKQHKPKSEILKENLQKLKLIKDVCTVKLDEAVIDSLIQRAVTRRPVKIKKKTKKYKKTVFTEEDFKKFEEEYTGE